jgi:hypothetical protein
LKGFKLNISCSIQLYSTLQQNHEQFHQNISIFDHIQKRTNSQKFEILGFL